MRRLVAPLLLGLLGLVAACSGRVDALVEGDAGGARLGDAARDAPEDVAELDQSSPDGCAPATCASLGVACGSAADGCGGVLSCGGCRAPEVCGGGGIPGVCGGSEADGGSPCSGGGGCCVGTCQSLHYECGTAGDGCGGVLECGGCPSGLTCTLNVCAK